MDAVTLTPRKLSGAGLHTGREYYDFFFPHGAKEFVRQCPFLLLQLLLSPSECSTEIVVRLLTVHTSTEKVLQLSFSVIVLCMYLLCCDE